MKHNHLLHTQLIEAIKNQDFIKVQELIAEGVKINYVNNSCSSTAIEAATDVGNIEIVDFLIRSKADPDKWYQRSPLVIATEKGFIDIANLLIDVCANVNTDPELDLTPLLCVVHLDSIQLVKKLIDAGADVSAWGRESNPPLSMAGCYGYKEIYEYLLPLIEPNYYTQFNEEGLFLAVMEQSLVGIEFLVSMNVNINCKDDIGETPLISATKYGHTSSAKKLMELDADIHIQDGKGHTALFYAIESNLSEIIKLLTDAGATS
jgi:uncharacterized protein